MNTPARAEGPLWKLDASALTRGYAEGRFTPSEALEVIHARIDERIGAKTPTPDVVNQ